MTNLAKIRDIEKTQLAALLAYFADHMSVCMDDGDNCIGCPIRQDGCCVWPDGNCEVSAFRWLGKECNEHAVWWSGVKDRRVDW